MLAINILMSPLLVAAPSGIDSWPDLQSKTVRADSAAGQDDQDTEEQDEAPPEEAQEEPQADEPEAPQEEPQQDAQTEEEAPPADTTDQDQTTGDGGSDDAAPAGGSGDEGGAELDMVDRFQTPPQLQGNWCTWPGGQHWMNVRSDHHLQMADGTVYRFELQTLHSGVPEPIHVPGRPVGFFNDERQLIARYFPASREIQIIAHRISLRRC